MEERFLARIKADREPVAAGAVALVVAHPDDECLAIGAQLPRLAGLTIVHVTDGAPRGTPDVARHGFASPEAYAAVRRRELEQAVGYAGVAPDALVAFGIPDQEASLRMPDIIRRLTTLVEERRVGLILTHAYEGGHPDHDAVAFCVHAARRRLARKGLRVGAIEMPFYHASRTGWVRQRFVSDPTMPEAVIRLGPEEMSLKRRMLEAHATQRETLVAFAVDEERFRPAPDYDFTVLPNEGDLLYERYGWGMTGARWLDLARAALAGERAAACA